MCLPCTSRAHVAICSCEFGLPLRFGIASVILSRRDVRSRRLYVKAAVYSGAGGKRRYASLFHGHIGRRHDEEKERHAARAIA